MKNKIYLITLLLIGSLLNSCDSDDLKYQNEFGTSKEKWLDFKKSSDNSYKFVVTGSSWTGLSWETTITVENGMVIQRDFQYTSTAALSSDIPHSELQWTETGSEIGTHKNGAEPITLDEVYNLAQHDWLIERKDTRFYLETENDGMISTCGYVENLCADDCFVGINIKNIVAF